MFEHKIDQDLSIKLKDHQDSEELFKVIEQSRAHLKEWMTWTDSIRTVEDVAKATQRNLIDFSQQKAMHYLILFKGKIVGTIGLKQFDWTVKSAEIGYWISPDHQGKGIITRAAKTMIAYGFDQIKLNKIEIWAAEKNTKSRNVPERLGFVLEGMRRSNEYLDGEYHNMMIYGLLKTEWTNQQERHSIE